jgi:hypothetical protein
LIGELDRQLVKQLVLMYWLYFYSAGQLIENTANETPPAEFRTVLQGEGVEIGPRVNTAK